MLTEGQKEIFKGQAMEEKANYQLKCEAARRLVNKGVAAPVVVEKKPAKQVEKKVTLTKQASSSSLSSVQSDEAGIQYKFYL